MKVTFKLIGLSALALTVALCGCLPVVSSAMRNAQANQMAMNGRKLIQGIIQANINRMGEAPPVWPRTYVEEGGNIEDVASRAYTSSAEYFNVLFDMEHYGTAEWNPLVDGDLLSTLGKNAVVGNRINPAGLDWCIAANVGDETQDFLPVLISANVNPALLPCNKFNGKDDDRLPIGPPSGATRSMLGDKMIVLVRKSGAAETYKEKYARYDVLLNHQGFDNSSSAHKIVWLTPTGIAEPAGR
ncbi:MAG: hypothetical protein J6V72_13770 [Kiritimatiellae bacterium]|nr:hypothetical protein [Kiritimatiellia bacterium]